jgi:hypothetical protein
MDDVLTEALRTVDDTARAGIAAQGVAHGDGRFRNHPAALRSQPLGDEGDALITRRALTSTRCPIACVGRSKLRPRRDNGLPHGRAPAQGAALSFTPPTTLGRNRMLVFLLRRLAQSIFVLIAMMIVVFFGVYMIGNPIDILISPDATPAEIAETMARFGFDEPAYVQFLKFVGNALQGDLGRSFVHGESAVTLILSYMPATLELAHWG